MSRKPVFSIIATAAALGVAVVLSGCNTGPATPEQMATIQSQCSGYGFKRGTDAFSACVFQMDQSRIAEARTRRREIGQALEDAGDDMQRQQQARQSVTCTSTPFGTSVRTTCN